MREGEGSHIVVFIMTADQSEAEKIAHALVKEGLAACVNIIGGIKSIYTWQGRLEEATESLLICKTQAALFPPLKKRVKEIHSYEVPEIISVPIRHGDEDYLGWITEVTRSQDPLS